MSKVLIITNRFNLGGITSIVAYLTKYLSPDFETMLVGGPCEEKEGNSLFILQNLGIEPVIIPEMHRKISFYNDFMTYIKIKKIIKDFKPDIVHTHASKAGFIGRYAAHRLKVPIIVHTFHGHIFQSYFNKYKTTFFKKLERKVAKYSDAIIAISEIQKKELCDIHKIAPAQKFRVIPIGFDLDKFQENYDIKRQYFRNKYNISDDKIAISIVGRLVPVKNHDLFIRAIANVKERTNKKICAIIVGDGELRNNLIKLINELHLTYSSPEKTLDEADIIFTSWIKEADFVFAGSDITALTSFNEGTPVSLIEAQAANTPIVSTNVGGIEDIVINGKTALLAENNNLEDFSEKLFQLIENNHLRNEMSNMGWNFVKDKFHYKRLMKDMKELYENLMDEK